MRAFVTCGFGSPTYTVGVKRLRASATKHAPDVALVDFLGELPPLCPPHFQVPFAFKPYALEAARAEGFTSVVWLDSCTVVTRDTTPLWEALERGGTYLTHDGWNTGQWCADSALGHLGITREEAFGIFHLHAGIVGLDLATEAADTFLQEWIAHAHPGGPFCGPWHADARVSDDDRVLGHRHDQTVASVIAWRLGMKPARLSESLYAYEVDRPDACLLAISPWAKR